MVNKSSRAHISDKETEKGTAKVESNSEAASVAQTEQCVRLSPRTRNQIKEARFFIKRDKGKAERKP
jgi:hypothetical protein